MRRGAADGAWEVVVPGVVVDEAVRQYPDRLRQAVNRTRILIESVRIDLQALGQPAPAAPRPDVDALIETYEQALHAALNEPGFRIADPPTETESVGGWAATRRSPFKDDRTGTCDAFVWLTVLDLAEQDEVILVSANHNDFGDRDDRTQLAPALLHDIERRGLDPTRIRRVHTIHQLVSLILTPEQRAIRRAQAILDDRGRLAHLIGVISFAKWSPSRWDSVEDWNLKVDVEDFNLQALDLNELGLESEALEANGDLTMLLRGTGTASFDFFVEKGEMVHAPTTAQSRCMTATGTTGTFGLKLRCAPLRSLTCGCGPTARTRSALRTWSQPDHRVRRAL